MVILFLFLTAPFTDWKTKDEITGSKHTTSQWQVENPVSPGLVISAVFYSLLGG